MLQEISHKIVQNCAVVTVDLQETIQTQNQFSLHVICNELLQQHQNMKQWQFMNNNYNFLDTVYTMHHISCHFVFASS
jgi:hypothetical protein